MSNKANEILERITSNNCQWADVRSNPGKKTQNLALGQDSVIKAPVQAAVVMTQTTTESSIYCEDKHIFDPCPRNLASNFFVGNQASEDNPKNNTFSNTYNPGWRNHPNF